MAPEKRHTFISYSRVNKEFALKLAKELKAAGLPVWLDQLDIPTGKRWDDEIENALRECRIFMVILTPASIASDNTKDEIGYAIDHGKRILPVLLEDCEVPLRLRRFQYVDFTKMNYNEGVRYAQELLAEMIEEESAPTLTRSAGKERSTIPAKARSTRPASAHKKAAYPQKSSDPRPSSQNRLSTKPVAMYAGIAVLVIFILIVGVALVPGMLSPQGTPTSVPTQESRVTDPVTSTVIAETSTPASRAQSFYTEEFDHDDLAWTFHIESGQENDFERRFNDGKLVIHIPAEQTDAPSAYLINESIIYDDVKMEVVTTNTGNSQNGVSLICRYSDDGWYEFWISNGGNYAIYAFGPGGEIRKSGHVLEKGGSPLIHTGQATNVYTATCKGKELSLEINGTLEITTPARYDLTEGNIGIGFSSPQNLPIDVEFESLTISSPSPDS